MIINIQFLVRVKSYLSWKSAFFKIFSFLLKNHLPPIIYQLNFGIVTMEKN